VAQRRAILAWAKTRGIDVVSWFEDQVSGAADLARRPSLVAAAQRAGLQRACSRASGSNASMTRAETA
jgi:DNA invertase Pin-like site-specific DNA recombinase